MSTQPKTVLITGATGFVGQRVARALADRGDRVIGLSRAAREPGDGVSAWHVWASPGDALPAAALDGVDAVVHLAGEPVAGRWSAEKKARIRDSRVLGTRSVVAGIAAAASRPAVLVSASAIGYYGDRGDEELVEGSAPGVDFLAEVCTAWEDEARAAEALDVRVARLRIGLVMHPDGGALAKMLLPFKLGLGGKMGSGRQWMSWIHLDDLVGLVLFALDNPGAQGAINATAPEPARNRDFAKALGKALHRPTFLPTPGFALSAALGEFSTEVLSSKRVLPARAQALGYTFTAPALGPALRDLLAG